MGLTPEPFIPDLDDDITHDAIEKGAADAAAARTTSDQALQTVIDSSSTGPQPGPIQGPTGPTTDEILPSGAVAEALPDGTKVIVNPDD